MVFIIVLVARCKEGAQRSRAQRQLRCEGDEKRRDGEEGEEGVRGEITAAGRRGVEWKADTKRGTDGGKEGEGLWFGGA